MKEKFSNLIDVKSIVTLVMTAALIALLFMEKQPPAELLALYCTSYGAVITYFFTKKAETSTSEDKTQNPS